MGLTPLKQDLTIYEKLDPERPPVGIKYLYCKPDGIKQLDKKLALCEMFREAQTMEEPFYVTSDNENCSGKLAMGWMGMPPWAESGQIGEKIEAFEDARANQLLYRHFHEFKPGIVNYIVFSRLDKLTFEPDLLILSSTPSQAEILLRAMTYSTGELWQSKSTPVLGCSWLFVYPYETGNVNYVMTGINFGMKAREVFPDGLVLFSIPFNWIPVIAQNLRNMKWTPTAYEIGKEEWIKLEEHIFTELEKSCAPESNN